MSGNSGVRDPAFWKRFSYAVHLDEESPQRPELKTSDSWLGRQQRKRKHRTCVCCAFWLSFFLFIAAVVIAIIVLLNSGMLNKIGDGHGMPDQPMDPNSDVTRRALADVTEEAAGRMLRMRYRES